MLKDSWKKYSLVIVLSIIVAILTMLHVILSFSKTPEGMVYLWTGHYYLDYFYYLQFIAQGLRGNWLPRQYSATDDPSLYFHLEPYVVIGQAGRLFQLSPISIYWIAVFILAVLLTLFIFSIIRLLLKDKPFYLQLTAFLIAITAAPLFKVVNSESGLKINLFDYWASYGTFLKRFEPVPHHLLAHILVLITFLFCYKYFSRPVKSLKISFIFALIISIFLASVLSFYPFQVIALFIAIAFTVLIYFLKELRQKKHKEAVSLIVFIITTGSLVFLAGLIINSYYYQTVFFQSTKGVEVGWRRFVEIKDVILNLGLVLILSLFGLSSFIKKINSLGIMLISFVLTSFALFYSPLDLVLSTHNGRFLSPLSYILFAALAVLGIEKIVDTFALKNKSRAFITAFLVFFIISLPPNIISFEEKLNDKNLDSPITYLPTRIIDGFEFLGRQPQRGNVLMTPSQFLGTVIPAYTDRRTYVARHAATPNYIEKNIRTSNFYLGAMTNQEALNFLQKNGLRFVVLTSIEGYDVKQLFRYPFLEEIYRNKDIIIFKVK